MQICTYICIHTYGGANTSVYINMYMCINQTCMNTYTYKLNCTYMHMYISTCTYVYIYKYTYIYICI